MSKETKEKTKRILVVEDNATNKKLFHDVLVNKGFEVSAIEDGTKAYEEALTFKPDLILLDIQLNNISGIDVIRQLKESEELRDIPVAAVTAFAMVEDEEKILAAGFDKYITKPISIGLFLEEVNTMLASSGA